MPLKLRITHKREFTYHIQNPEKIVKEFEKLNFASVSLSKFIHFDYLRLAQLLHFKFIIRIESKVRRKARTGERG